jgi:glucose-6-phosphate isomerase
MSPPHTTLGALQQAVDDTLAKLRDEQVIERIWQRDHTVWKPDPTEIANRLGWLDSPATMPTHLSEIKTVVDAVRQAGYTNALLLGMGGSSLAPEVFSRTFGTEKGYLELNVLDSTDPDAVRQQAERLDPARTLFIAATKSGGTVETMSFLKYFYNRTCEAVGADKAGAHFAAITDPGSGLADLARALDFRHIFLNDPDIGGRYAALSFFGLVAAGLIGMDVDMLLERARDMAAQCARSDHNPGALLGATLGVSALAGRDKVTLVTSPPIAAFGAWVEQLIAESTGKEGRGILPVDNETPGPPSAYADDRLFVYLRLHNDDTCDRSIQALIDSGHPVVRLDLRDPQDLGGEFFRWEMATIVAGYGLDINPFDQPDVEAAKVLARTMVEAFQEQGRLPPQKPTFESGAIAVFSETRADSLGEALRDLLARAHNKGGRSYIALQAYLKPDAKTDIALHDLRLALRDQTQMATTLGYGPRFLHSTGQLHKGDAGHGLFVQLTSDASEDIEIPDQPGYSASSISFGVLKTAQALGDRQALLDNQRPVLRIHLGKEVLEGLKQVRQALT